MNSYPIMRKINLKRKQTAEDHNPDENSVDSGSENQIPVFKIHSDNEGRTSPLRSPITTAKRYLVEKGPNLPQFSNHNDPEALNLHRLKIFKTKIEYAKLWIGCLNITIIVLSVTGLIAFLCLGLLVNANMNEQRDSCLQNGTSLSECDETYRSWQTVLMVITILGLIINFVLLIISVVGLWINIQKRQKYYAGLQNTYMAAFVLSMLSLHVCWMIAFVFLYKHTGRLVEYTEKVARFKPCGKIEPKQTNVD